MSKQLTEDKVREIVMEATDAILAGMQKLHDENGAKIDRNAKKIDRNAERIDRNARKIDRNARKIDRNAEKIDTLEDRVDDFQDNLLKRATKKEVKELKQKVDHYQPQA